MKTNEQNNTWNWIIAIIFIVGGFYIFSQWQVNNQSTQADKVFKAKQACQWDGKRNNWDASALATCNKLGTADYSDQTEHYYKMYDAKQRYDL